MAAVNLEARGILFCREQITTLEFPGGPQVRILGFHCHSPGLIPGQGTEIHKPSSAEETHTHITTSLARGRAALNFKRQLTVPSWPHPVHRKPPASLHWKVFWDGNSPGVPHPNKNSAFWGNNDLNSDQIPTLALKHPFSRYSRVPLSVTLWTVAHQTPLLMSFSRQQYWRGLPCPPWRIFPTQESNRRCLCLLHWQAGSLPLAPAGKPQLHSVAKRLGPSKVCWLWLQCIFPQNTSPSTSEFLWGRYIHKWFLN